MITPELKVQLLLLGYTEIRDTAKNTLITSMFSNSDWVITFYGAGFNCFIYKQVSKTHGQYIAYNKLIDYLAKEGL